MTDIERVKQMVQDGRITSEEGDRLIAVLSDAQAVDQELEQVGMEIDAEAQALQAPTVTPANAGDLADAADRADLADRADRADGADLTDRADASVPAFGTPARPAQPRAPLPPEAPMGPGSAPRPPASPRPPLSPNAAPPAGSTKVAPEGTRWVRVEMLAGDLEVTVDESLSKPAVKSDGPGNLIVDDSNDGFHVRWDQAGGGLLDRVLGKLRAGDLEVRIPPGHGVDLAATAGDVDLEGVPYLRGHLTAGNLEATGLKGIDFTSRAGDIDVVLELNEGEHRMNVTAGNVNVKLSPSSSVTVKADVSIGNANSSVDGVRSSGQGLGAGLSGAVGAGDAKLDVHITTGNINLGARRG